MMHAYSLVMYINYQLLTICHRSIYWGEKGEAKNGNATISIL